MEEDEETERRLAEAVVAREGFSTPPRSRFQRDPELAVYAAGRFGRATLKTIRAECLAKFGRRRVPSISALHRYWQRIRVLPT